MYDKRTHIGILITSICGIISSSRSAHAKIKKEKKKDRVPVDVAPPCHVHDGGFRTRRSPAMSLISLSNHASWRKVNVGPIGFVDADVWINAENDTTRHDNGHRGTRWTAPRRRKHSYPFRRQSSPSSEPRRERRRREKFANCELEPGLPSFPFLSLSSLRDCVLGFCGAPSGARDNDENNNNIMICNMHRRSGPNNGYAPQLAPCPCTHLWA